MSLQTTQQIINGSDARFHLAHEVGNPWISSVSRWMDRVWVFDNMTPGATPFKATMRWDLLLPDGRMLTEPSHATLLDSLRRFVWSLFIDPRYGSELKPGSVSHLSSGIRHLLAWMISRGYKALNELDADAADLFLEDLIDKAAKSDLDLVEAGEGNVEEADGELSDSTDGGLSLTTAYNRINIWRLLWRQSTALIDAGLKGLPDEPFDGESAKSVAMKVSTRAAGKIPPLPETIALLLMDKAHQMIGTPAEDIIRLQTQYLNAYKHGKECGTSQYPSTKWSKAAVEAFIFSVCPNDTVPWRGPIQPVAGEYLVDASGITIKTELGSIQILRNLIMEVRNACCIVIQSESGMRINEICSLRAGLNDAGLPACVEIRRSKTGLNELFYVRGLLAKTTKVPITVEWLLGSRPIGSAAIPPPVQAIAVLQRLMAPWRDMASSPAVRESLLVAFTYPKGLPKRSSSIGPIKTQDLRNGQKVFARRHINWENLPDDPVLKPYIATRGACLKTHQWRKNFARYMFQTDSRMIPAIAQQFHHLSLGMTEQGYLGNDPLLIEELDNARKISTTDFLFKAARGKEAVAGRLAKLISKHREELQAVIEGKNERDGRLSMERWIIERDLKIFFAPHGKCFIRLSPSAARCHEVANTAHWAQTEPNYKMREPSLCVGCNCFAVDEQHAGFWIQRYVENQRAWLQARSIGIERDYRVAKERADQSLAILQAIQVPVPNVEV